MSAALYGCPVTQATLPPEQRLGITGRAILIAVLAAGLVLASSDPFAVFFFVSYAVLAALLVARKPRNAIGWLLLVIAFGFVAVASSPWHDLDALRAGTESTADFLGIWVTTWAGYLMFGCFAALTVLFPTGRLPAGRWRRPAIALFIGCGIVIVLSAVAPTMSYNPDSGVATIAVPNRLAVLPDLFVWAVLPVDLFIIPVVAFLAVGVVSMLVRYRRSRGIERLQLRWLVASLTFVVLAVVGGLVLGTAFPAIGGGAWIFTIIAFPTVPIAIYVAVTRYRLFEIDRIISRTLGWLLVTLVLASVFAAAVIGLQALLEPWTGNSTIAVAASTLLVASLFQPLRRPIQHLVDRRFNRARTDAEAVARDFAGRLRSETALDLVGTDLRTTIRGALEPVAIDLWLRPRAARPDESAPGAGS
jgi:hypothetical protein